VPGRTEPPTRPAGHAPSRAFVHESAPLLSGDASAVFSEDRAYRYRLTRTWGSSGTHVTWIMLNPSTADAMTDDPTIRRCTAFTKAWGFDGLIVVNLFAFRATDPRGLACADPVGPDNDRFIREAIAPWSVVVAAWGAHGHLWNRGFQVARTLSAEVTGLACLGVTKAGQPRHPLYVRADAPLIPYLAPGSAP
jgi:hypothetical protein